MHSRKRWMLGVVALMAIHAASAEDGALSLRAAGFENGHGRAIAKLILPGEDFFGPKHRETSATITDGQALLAFGHLAAGRYAVVVFHDENGNGVIDHNLLRLPIESIGFSNQFVPSVFSGPPNFEKLAFEHGAASQTLEIVVK